jgi:hypothetical protein
MTTAEKTIILQDLQVSYAEWLVAFSNALSLGKCVEKLLQDNVVISNLIDVVYRYIPSDAAETTITNCLTEEEVCEVINKIRILTDNCNC